MFSLAALPACVAGIVRDAVAVLARLGAERQRGRGELGPVLVAIMACIERRLRRFERMVNRVLVGEPAVTRRPRAETPLAPARRMRARAWPGRRAHRDRWEALCRELARGAAHMRGPPG